MAKKAAVVAVNPVNGMGLFQYLETFFENKIPCTVFAVAESREIRTNSGIGLTADDVITSRVTKRSTTLWCSPAATPCRSSRSMPASLGTGT